VTNHRGLSLPVTLGLVVAITGAIGVVLALLLADVTGGGAAGAVASAVVFAAGFVDDLSSGGPRGIRGHLSALVHMRVTTGVIKLVVITGCAIVVAAWFPRSGGSTIAGIVLMAGCANLWNGLDVAPGRALKVFLPVALVLLATAPHTLVTTHPGVTAGGVAVLPADLRERAVLGDGGANLLGFTVGIGLFVTLSSGALWVAAAVTVGLNVLADTYTLSRAIESSPPLRWFDRLGRVPAGR
jgi:hypothetical protein